MATGWNSQQGEGKFAIQFETTHKDLYKLVEKACQDAVDKEGEKNAAASGCCKNGNNHMEHIKEQYGSRCNLLNMKEDDFWALRDFLAEMGVQIRMVKAYAGECVIQGQNLNSKDAAIWHN